MKKASFPLWVVSMKYELDVLLPLESRETVPVLTSYSYASSRPFVSSGTSASGLVKKTRDPSSVIGCVLGGSARVPPIVLSPVKMVAFPVAGAPLGVHDAHATVL